MWSADSIHSLTRRGGMDAILLEGLFGVPWSIVLLLAVVAVGLLLIRAAITLVKVAIVVGIGIAIYLLVQFVLKNFGA